MSNILSTLLKAKGYRILGVNQKESIITTLDSKEHLGTLVAPYTVEKNGQKYVVVVNESEAIALSPLLRSRLIEYDRVFGLKGLLLFNEQSQTLEEISFKYPRERNLDFYFQFFMALLVIVMVLGIIWLMAWLRLY